MSPVEEAAKLTENAYKTIMEQYNPCLRNFVAMGKCYEKALSGVTHAAKGYFDALVKLGEIGSESQASKELGDTVFQMAEVHRQIQMQMEEAIKSLHIELLSKLEQKLEQDVKYVTLTLKRYQVEHRVHADGVEKVRAELKRISKKSSKNPTKYREREAQVLNHMQVRHAELQRFVSEGYRNALVEERRRYCFLVDRHCAVTQIFSQYHGKAKELMTHKMASWQTCCLSPSSLPPRVSVIFQKLQAPAIEAGPGETGGPRSGSFSMMNPPGPPMGGPPPPFVSAPAPGDAATLPVSHELAPFVAGGRRPEPRTTLRRELPAVPNGGIPPPVARTSSLGRGDGSLGGGSSSGSAGSVDEDLGAPGRAGAGTGERRGVPRPPPAQSAGPAANLQYRTLPAKRTQHNSGGGGGGGVAGGGGGKTGSGGAASGPQLARSSSASAGLDTAGAGGAGSGGGGPGDAGMRVEALFQHVAGTQEGTLLSFEVGDVIAVLAPQPQDGWQYGENERTSRRGWFPVTYTRPLDADDDTHSSHGEPDTLSSTGSIHEGELGLPATEEYGPSPYDTQSTEGGEEDDPSALRENPFYSIRLKPTVTNDRSAPHM